jgi:hypothetical protein
MEANAEAELHQEANGGNGADGTRSPQRTALAEAIAERDVAAKAVATALDALDRARREAWAARDKLDAAAKKLERARAGENVVQALLAGNSSGRGRQLRATRAKYVEVEDNLSVARSAVARLETIVLDHERALEQANEQIAAAAREVLKAEAPDVSAELKIAEQRFVELRATVTWLLWHGAIANDPRAAADVDYAAKQGWGATETRLRRNIFYPEDQQTTPWAAWEQCWEALLSDPDAPLPAA